MQSDATYNRSMNTFWQHLNSPPTEAECIARQEEIARTEERRLLASDLAFEYGHDIELREFRGSRRVDPSDDTGCTAQEIAAYVQGARPGFSLVDEYFSRVRS